MTTPVPTKLDDADKEALRQLIRQELQALRPEAPQPAALAGAADKTTPADAHAVAPALSDDQAIEYKRARVLVDDRVARGSWTEDDRASLRAMLGDLPAEARQQIIRTLVVAANEGRVQVDVRGQVF